MRVPGRSRRTKGTRVASQAPRPPPTAARHGTAHEHPGHRRRRLHRLPVRARPPGRRGARRTADHRPGRPHLRRHHRQPRHRPSPAGVRARRHPRRGARRPADGRGGPGRALRRRVPRGPLDPRRVRLRPHQRRRHPDPAGRRPAPRGGPLRARLHRRGVRLPGVGRGDRGASAAAEFPVLRVEGVGRPAGPVVPPHPRPRRTGDPVLQQLRPAPVPREARAAVRHPPPGRPPGPAVRRRAQRPRLAARRRPLPGRRPRPHPGPGGRGLQHRRRHRADQPRAHRPAPRRLRGGPRPGGPRRGPQGPRPALRGRLEQGPRGTGLPAPARLRGRTGRDRRLVPGQQGLVGTAQAAHGGRRTGGVRPVGPVSRASWRAGPGSPASYRSRPVAGRSARRCRGAPRRSCRSSRRWRA